MREIKFRAWDITHKNWYTRVHVGTNCGHAVYDEEREQWLEFDDFCGPVVQWTGMYDKRETPIFEGDIVDFSVFDHNGSDTQYRGVVKFSSGQWELWNSVDSEYYGSDGGFMLYWVHQQDDGIEAIGNVYQNPELINS